MTSVTSGLGSEVHRPRLQFQQGATCYPCLGTQSLTSRPLLPRGLTSPRPEVRREEAARTPAARRVARQRRVASLGRVRTASFGPGSRRTTARESPGRSCRGQHAFSSRHGALADLPWRGIARGCGLRLARAQTCPRECEDLSARLEMAGACHRRGGRGVPSGTAQSQAGCCLAARAHLAPPGVAARAILADQGHAGPAAQDLSNRSSFYDLHPCSDRQRARSATEWAARVPKHPTDAQTRGRLQGDDHGHQGHKILRSL